MDCKKQLSMSLLPSTVPEVAPLPSSSKTSLQKNYNGQTDTVDQAICRKRTSQSRPCPLQKQQPTDAFVECIASMAGYLMDLMTPKQPRFVVRPANPRLTAWGLKQKNRDCPKGSRTFKLCEEEGEIVEEKPRN